MIDEHDHVKPCCCALFCRPLALALLGCFLLSTTQSSLELSIGLMAYHGGGEREAMESELCKIVIFGGTGYIGKYMMKAEGGCCFVLKY